MATLGRPALLAAISSALILGGCSTPGFDRALLGTEIDGVDPGTMSWPLQPTTMALSPSGGTLLAGCGGGLCRWDTDTGASDRLRVFPPVAWSPDGSRFAAKGDDAQVLIVDAADLTISAVLAGHHDTQVMDVPGPITSIQFSPDGNTLATVGWDDTLQLWRVSDGRRLAKVDAPALASVSFSPNSERLVVATSGSDPSVTVLDARRGRSVETLDHVGGGDVAWSPDGRWLAHLDEAGAIVIRDAESFEITSSLPSASGAWQWSPDGTLIAHIDEGGRLALRETDGFTPSYQGPRLGLKPTQMAFSPDQPVLAMLDREGAALWHWEAGSELTPLNHIERPTALGFAADGGWLLTAYTELDDYPVSSDFDRDDHTDAILVWDVATGEQVRTLDLP
ncbi:WD40 repeat domain-containing protein [Nocardioides limicola]|uniref:WD40 repeat domain-containing protein n=1 Tax=Nocardioides limicola TaxID=2803368 RepID=UPI00193B5FB0|nr:WD40 repeat domain-containing protein [Nocardioides sp. DJM-14]